ncbi:PREDICTED: Golgi integral membrane protein 4-like isoform X1 [Acromyrmex echinatior]|uniref:Golgi integral membrane protein 4-like isoform X1 n=2 Tax=Acromyrmex echinatior TaxID=103372 RepID=UPI000580D373|nr:PREDICTED: Golgi integral membrane protein 4-like isoform X1 [Acromyrmex echinatior]
MRYIRRNLIIYFRIIVHYISYFLIVMSGSRLGRGRGGRLALYGGCAVAVILTMIVYRNTISEMTRLQEMQVQCLHQQESLAAQLQVIFEYKVRLEKSLAEEKSSNAAVKQELQQRATREKSLRDKDSIEAMQRFNSLQQTYKLLQTEHRDLQEECKKREKQTLDETSRLESTLQDLRARIRQAQEDKSKALEHLKTKYLEIIDEKTRLQEKYNELINNRDNTGSTVDHLRKEIFQLRRELESAKNFYARSTPPSSVLMTPRASVSQSMLPKEDLQPIPAPQQQQSMVSLRKAENTTVANNANLVSPSLIDKPAPLPARLPSKVKVPVGVLPIPEIIEQKVVDDMDKKKEIRDDVLAVVRNNLQPPLPKLAPANAVDDKEEKEPIVEAGNLDPPFVVNPPARHVGEQLERRAKDSWLRVGPGVQEIGDELNRVPGLDDGQANGGDDQYDGADYDKESQQKNDIHLAGEDEGEDEGDILEGEYPNNLKQGKRE